MYLMVCSYPTDGVFPAVGIQAAEDIPTVAKRLGMNMGQDKPGAGRTDDGDNSTIGTD